VTQARAFTLIELLIVVAIVAILAAIALPNFLEAQTRAKASAARANIRTGIVGLEAYRVDANRYPPTRSIIPEDPLALFASVQLRVLTTPVAYIGPSAFRDPFGAPKTYSQIQQLPAANPGLVPPDALLDNERSLLYIHYPSTAVRFGDPRLDAECVSLVSIGPDGEDSLGGYCVLPPDVFQTHFPYVPGGEPTTTLYDPTNGTVSNGDVVGWTGALPR